MDTPQPMLRSALRFGAIVLAIAYSLSFFVVWYFERYSALDISNTMTGVALALGLLALPFLGAPSFSRELSAIEDPRELEVPGGLDNRARGVIALVIACLWLLAAIAVYSFFG